MTRVLITGARAPAALHLARLLHGAGHHVVMADSLRHTISSVSQACTAFALLPAANGDRAVYAAAVRAAIAAHAIDLVVPTCEEVFHLAAIWRDTPMDAPLFAPDIALLTQAHSKFAFTALAASLGLAVPDTRLLQSASDVAALRAQLASLVFKPVWSRFATDVLMCPKRVKIAPTPARPWVAQDFVAGDEISVYAVADAGRLMGWAGYRSLYRAGKGAGVAFARDDDPAVGAFVDRFVAGTGWTGQVSFDLIRQPGRDLVAIECNPRASSGVHFFRQPAAFAQAFNGTASVRPDVTGVQAVKAAMWVYGPLAAPRRFWTDIKTASDVLDWPNDPAPARKQIAATCEIARLSLRHRVGLVRASTYDIAWDGD